MKLVHLVGVITKKIVTMHGHMNVKKTTRPSHPRRSMLVNSIFLDFSPGRRGTKADIHTNAHTHTYWCDTIWEFITAAGYLKFAVRRIFRLKLEAGRVVKGKCTMKSRIILIFCKYY